MNFDIQYSTCISFLHFYLTCGIVFDSDGLANSSMTQLENQAMIKAKKLIRSGVFLTHDPEKLALSIIKEARRNFNLKPWNTKLEKLSGKNESDIESIDSVEKDNILKPLGNVLNLGNRDKNIPGVSNKVINLNASEQSNSIAKFSRKKSDTSANKQLNR